jgi:hypothetical protein
MSCRVQRFRTFALPATRPQRPFGLQSAEVRKDDLRPIATSLLGQFETYFAAPNPRERPTTDWTIVKHDCANAYYELHSNQIGALTSLVNYGYAPGAARADLNARGFDGPPPQAFNHALELGLYLVSGTAVQCQNELGRRVNQVSATPFFIDFLCHGNSR